MLSQNHYSGAIWTNHVLQRLKERGLSQAQAGQAFTYPDRRFSGSEPGSTRFEKRFGTSRVTVVAKKNDRNEWIVLSAWIDPPLPGTADARKKLTYKKYQRATFWGKVWMNILQQLGIIKY